MSVQFAVANVTTTGFDIVNDKSEVLLEAVVGDRILLSDYPPTEVLGTYTLSESDLDPESTEWNIGAGGHYLWAGFEEFSSLVAGTNYYFRYVPTGSERPSVPSEPFSISISMSVPQIFPAMIRIYFTGYTAIAGDSLVIADYGSQTVYTQSLSVGDTGHQNYAMIDFDPDFLMTLNTTYVVYITNPQSPTIVPYTTFALSPSIHSYTFSVTNVSATSFSLANFTPTDEIYIGDTLQIVSVEMLGESPKFIYATYTYIADDFGTYQTLNKAYPLNTFSPSDFSLTSGTHYNLTFSTRVIGYIAPYTTDLYFSSAPTPSINIKTTTQLGITILYKNYTSAANDTLVITSSGSPTITLSANIVADDSTGATRTYLFSDFSPSFNIIINTSYTLTLNYPTGNSTTTTFNLSALGTTPDFTVTNVSANGFEITNPSNYTLNVGDTLNITSANDLGSTIYGVYQIKSTDTQLNRAYMLSEFTLTPSNFSLTVDTQYYLILAPVVGGYFNPRSKSFSYSPTDASITIASQTVTENGFTVSFSDYTSVPGDTLVITPPNSSSPTLILGSGEPEGGGDITYLYTDFSPRLATAVNTTYTVTLNYGNTKTATTTFILNATNTTPTFTVTGTSNGRFTITDSSFSVQVNDTLEIKDSTGATLYASYAFSTAKTLNGTYALSLFTLTPSNFLFQDNVTYKITIAPYVTGYFNSTTKNFIFLQPSITVSNPTTTGATLTFYNCGNSPSDFLLSIYTDPVTYEYSSNIVIAIGSSNQYTTSVTWSSFTKEGGEQYSPAVGDTDKMWFNALGTESFNYDTHTSFTIASPPAEASITIASQSVTENGFTVSFSDYTSEDGDTLVVTPPSSNSPSLNITVDSIIGSGEITVVYNSFSPPLATAVNTTYTVTLNYSSNTKTATTTFILNATNTTPTFTVAATSNSGFTITNSSFSVQANDTLKIRDSAGTTLYASYTFSASQTLNGTYALSAFTRTPSNFVLQDNVTYKITIAPFVSGYFNSVTKDLSYSPPSADPSITIASQSVTENGFTVSFSNYTSVNGDELVITGPGLADAPLLTLREPEEGLGEITVVYNSFSPPLATAVNTTYTVTLNYGNNNATTTTFILNATNTTPTFTVAATSNSGFTITNSSFSVQANNTLEIKDSTGTTLYASYTFSASQTLNDTYALSAFNRTPSNFVLQDNVTYKLILAPYVTGYFNPVTNDLSYSPSSPDASITIASQSVTENGFTVSFSDYTSTDDDTLVITPPSSNSPSIIVGIDNIIDSGFYDYFYTDFSPSLATAVNTTYTVTLNYSGNTKTATTTFILNATNTTPTFTVAATSNSGFTITNSSFSVQANDTLKIRDSAGTTLYASYAFSTAKTLNGTYALSTFTRTPSNFVLQDNVTYKITIAPFVSGYFNSVTNNLSYSPPPPDPSITIASQSVTENGFTVSFSNYTSVNGDTLVITPPNSSSPSLTLAVNDVTGSGDKAYLYSAFSPSLATAVNTTYTVTLRYSSNTKTATTTFILNATNTTPSFTVIAGKNNEFTISNSTYTVQKNDTLKIKDSTGTTQYATYAFSSSRSIAGTYAWSLFTLTPSNFVLQDNVVYKLTLAPYVAGYFNSVTKNITFSPPSVSISNVAATGFTVRFSNYVSQNNDTLSLTWSGITTAPKITYSTSPNIINAPAGTPQTKNYTFSTDFSPSFTLALDTTYTATLRINGGTTVSATTYFTKSSPTVPCFREGSQILCDISGVETYRAIETLRPGTLVKTLTCGLVPIEMIGHTKLKNPGHGVRIQNRLYKCSKANYPTLTEDLYITGCHSILEGYMSETQKETTIAQLGRLFVTEGKYRLMACIDERAMPHLDDAEYTIWHIALENTEYYKNYGVWANGLLVETCSKRYLKELSGMTLVV